MDNKVILDNASFRALSSNTRVEIVKNLNERRKNLSELSKKMDLKNSTIKEHCELLIDAGIIRKVDDGRKWKYYELTKKGEKIVNPSVVDDFKILIMISLILIAFSLIIFSLIPFFSMNSMDSELNNNLIIPESEIYGVKNTNTSSDSLSINTINNENDTKRDNGVDDNTLNNNIGGGIKEFNDSELLDLNNVLYLKIEYNLFAFIIILILLIGLFTGWFFGRKMF